MYLFERSESTAVPLKVKVVKVRDVVEKVVDIRFFGRRRQLRKLE